MFKQRLRRVEAIVQAAELAGAKPPARKLQTVQDLLDLLEEQVEAVRAAPWTGPLDKARAIAYLAGVARKTIEAGILAGRIEMLETVLKLRKDQTSHGR
jgi:hypothetical protein